MACEIPKNHRQMYRSRAWICLGAIFLLLFPSPIQAKKCAPRLKSRLEAAQGDEIFSVIVRFKSPEPPLKKRYLKHHLVDQTRTGRKALSSILADPGIENIQDLWIINGVSIKASIPAIKKLAAHPLVDTIVLNETIEMVAPLPPDASGIQPLAEPEDRLPPWNLSGIHAPDLWALGITGQDVVIASMDSGVDVNHADLQGRYRGGTNSWFDPNGEHETPHDESGHGTQTMGLILAGEMTGAPRGVAPGAQWIAVKIFNDEGVSTLSGIHQGYQWLLDPDGDPQTPDAPQIVNNAWGFVRNPNDCYSEFAADLAALEAAGIVSVFAGGNTGPRANTSISPANNTPSMTTGSVDTTWAVSDFSARGPNACDGSFYPRVVAPGDGVITTDLSSGGLFAAQRTVSGTSFAASHLSGVMALLKSAFPDATPAELRGAITHTARDLLPQGEDNDSGAGIVDALSAYQMLSKGCTLTVLASMVPASPTLEKTTSFSAIANGGTPPLSFAWDIDGDGLIDGTTATMEHTVTDYMHATATVTVRDATNCEKTQSIEVTLGIRIHGVVINTQGETVSQAPVCMDHGHAHPVLSNQGGTFTLSGPATTRIHLTAGPFTLGETHYATTHAPYIHTPSEDTTTVPLLLLDQKEITTAAKVAGAEPTSGAVMGTLIDPTGRPISGAVATLTTADATHLTPSVVYKNAAGTWDAGLTVTGPSGEFALFNIPSPPRDVWISAAKATKNFNPVNARIYALSLEENTITVATPTTIADPSTPLDPNPDPTLVPVPNPDPSTPPIAPERPASPNPSGTSGKGGCFLQTAAHDTL